MSLDGFVRAVGTALGVARDSFGGEPEGQMEPAASSPAAPGGLAPGAGQALQAFAAESGRLNSHVLTLAEQDDRAHAQLADAVAAATTGRSRVEGIIGAATASMRALAPATATPEGQQALVAALTQHLQSTQLALQDGKTDAATRAASSHATAAEYHAVAPISPTGTTSALPAQGLLMGATPLAGLGSIGGLLGTQPDLAGAGSTGQRTGPGAVVARAGGAVDAVVSRALSQHGIPYAWGGGGKAGPGRGDDGAVGFDCSSLMQYAFAGAGVDLPRSTYQQIGLGQTVSRADIQPGDLIFSEFGEGSNPGPGHVQLAISPNHVVEAPHTGANVRVSEVPAGHIVVKRFL